MSLYNRIKSRIKYEILKKFKPEMIGHSKDSLGNRVKDLRISNTTHMSNRENIKFNKNVFVGHFSYIDGFDKVTIGAGCHITLCCCAMNVLEYLHSWLFGNRLQ